MTEYQIKRNKRCRKLYSEKRRKNLKAIKERDNMINMAMRLVFEFEDTSAAMNYVRWKVRQMRAESAKEVV